MAVAQKKWDELFQEMEKLKIKEEDLVEKFILSSGKGGQKVQKTHSCVYLKHLPSSIEVKCSKTRNREDNRFFARRELCEKIAKEVYKKQTKKEQQLEKIRKQKKRRKRRQKKDNV